MAKTKKKVKCKGKHAAKPATSSVSDNVIAEVLNKEAIAAAYTPASQPVFMKLCRLCESKDGPFLNIFDADKITAKRIEELMPFGIAENDDLPHKICFRCSAKVEELHEFIQKCIKTQENLRKAVGNTAPLTFKTKQRALWEEKLNKSNISNDDICDALIKKAMEGIKDIPLTTVPEVDDKKSEVPPPKKTTRKSIEPPKNDVQVVDDSDTEISKKLDEEKPPVTRKTRSNKVEKVETENANTTVNTSKPPPPVDEKPTAAKQKSNISINSISIDVDEIEDPKKETDEVPPKEPEKPFNIMDHVSMIKVTGVGILFQCKLCNRNFVKKEVVESHNCAKNGVPKFDFTKNIPAPEPPKAPTVKYIKIDDSRKRALTEKNSKQDSKKINADEAKAKPEVTKPPEVKPKPKIGPASKMKKLKETNPDTEQKANTTESNAAKTDEPSVVFPSLPSLNGRYKLVPGPNNTFTLIEETSDSNPPPEEKKAGSKRKSSEVKTTETKPKQVEKDTEEKNDKDKQKPYPVGLFQTMPHHSGVNAYQPPVSEPTTFTTPAMKKQSYTVVQTGNPSKLVISTKPQPPVEAVPKKRQRKSKLEVRKNDTTDEPFKVTLEDVAPPKDPGFFTFINVDPLLQPSYVLPTDNIIQESQISTSTQAVSKAAEKKEKEKYSCNMCGLNFSREMKLLAHIHSHYSKMDEEDQLRTEKQGKKKGKKQ